MVKTKVNCFALRDDRVPCSQTRPDARVWSHANIKYNRRSSAFLCRAFTVVTQATCCNRLSGFAAATYAVSTLSGGDDMATLQYYGHIGCVKDCKARPQKWSQKWSSTAQGQCPMGIGQEDQPKSGSVWRRCHRRRGTRAPQIMPRAR